VNARLRFALGIAITAGFLYLALRDVNLEDVGRRLAAANLAFVIPALLCSLTGYLLRAKRWLSLLSPAAAASYGMSFSVLILGFAANNVLPARIGEVLRAYQMGRRLEISRSFCFSTIALERVCDGLTLLLFMGVVLWSSPLRSAMPEVQVVEVFATAIFLGAALAIGLLLFQERLALRMLTWAVRPLPERISKLATHLAEMLVMGLQSLRSKRHVAAIFSISVVVWSLEAVAYMLVLNALSVPLAPEQIVSAGFFLVVFVNLGIMIPSAPGYIGTFQLFAKLALGDFGVDPATAISVAILSHALQYFLVTGLGLAVFIREQTPLRQLTGARAQRGCSAGWPSRASSPSPASRRSP